MTVPASGVRAGPPEPLAGGGTPRERSAPPAGAVPARRAARPRWLVVAASAVALLTLVPLAFLLLEAVQDGWSTVAPLLFRRLTATLLWNTVSLTVVVTVLCALIGTMAAWVVERTDLPGRHMWAVLLVLPVAIPDFAVAFGWVSLAPWLHGFGGAVLVMTFAVYPLVYLPVAASLRSADPGQEEVARQLGGRARPHVLADHRGAGPAGHPRRVPPRRARAPRRVRRVRDPRLPDLHDRDLLGVRGGVQRTSGLRALTRARRPEPRGGGRREHGPRTRERDQHRPARRAPVSPAPAGPGDPPGARRLRAAGRARARGAVGRRRLLARPRGWLHPSVGVPRLGGVAHGCVRVGGRAARDGARPARRPALPPLPRPRPDGDRAQHLPGARRAGARDRPGAHLRLGALCGGVPLPVQPAVDRRVRAHVLPPRARRRAHLGRPGAGAARGGWPLARQRQARGALAGHDAPAGPWAGGGVLPRLPRGGDRVDSDPRPHPDRIADAGHPVLDVPDQRLLRAGGTFGRADGAHRGGARVRARTLVRPLARGRRAGT